MRRVFLIATTVFTAIAVYLFFREPKLIIPMTDPWLYTTVALGLLNTIMVHEAENARQKITWPTFVVMVVTTILLTAMFTSWASQELWGFQWWQTIEILKGTWVPGELI
jgi:ABC-type Na+ efflux pump permease subunit